MELLSLNQLYELPILDHDEAIVPEVLLDSPQQSFVQIVHAYIGFHTHVLEDLSDAKESRKQAANRPRPPFPKSSIRFNFLNFI